MAGRALNCSRLLFYRTDPQLSLARLTTDGARFQRRTLDKGACLHPRPHCSAVACVRMTPSVMCAQSMQGFMLIAGRHLPEEGGSTPRAV